MSRDDQFSGFAEVLLSNLFDISIRMTEENLKRGVFEQQSIGHIREAQKTMLAQRAYDFAVHVASHMSERAGALIETRLIDPEDVVRDQVPDMPVLAEEQAE